MLDSPRIETTLRLTSPKSLIFFSFIAFPEYWFPA